MPNENAVRSGRRALGALAVLAGAAFALPQPALAATNTISTVAGGARPTTQCTVDWVCTVNIGDGGPAAAAALNLPYGVATTPDGGYVVSQLNANRVRRVS